MAEKPENLNKKDLEIILEVNRKAIEIETEVADQNEEIISLLNYNKEKIDKMEKDIFKIQVLFITGILGLIIQLIQLFKK